MAQFVEFLNHASASAARGRLLAVHCRGGKGRTGSMCCAWLLYTKTCDDADDALNLFALERTELALGRKKLQGVETPSQRRYVHQVCGGVGVVVGPGGAEPRAFRRRPRVSLPLPTRSLPVPTRSLPLPTRSLPVPTRSLPVPTRSLPVPTRSLPVPTSPTPTTLPPSRRVPPPGGRAAAVAGSVLPSGRRPDAHAFGRASTRERWRRSRRWRRQRSWWQRSW